MPFNSFLDYPISWKPERSRLTRPIYLSLAKQLEQDIAAGFLAPGTKLSPQRELSDFLDINFTTVIRSYRLCKLKRLIYARTGSGFVSPPSPFPTAILRRYSSRFSLNRFRRQTLLSFPVPAPPDPVPDLSETIASYPSR